MLSHNYERQTLAFQKKNRIFEADNNDQSMKKKYLTPTAREARMLLEEYFLTSGEGIDNYHYGDGGEDDSCFWE